MVIDIMWPFIRKVVEKVTGPWCRCIVLLGSHGQLVIDILLLAGPAHAPQDAVVMPSSTSQSLELRWRPGYHGGYPPQWFVLMYKPAAHEGNFITSNHSVTAADDGFVTITVTGLQPRTNYSLELFAVNSRPHDRASSDHILLSGVTRRKAFSNYCSTIS